MTIDLVIFTDGRADYLRQTLQSAEEHLAGDIRRCWLHDDTGDDSYRQDLRDLHRHFRGTPIQHLGRGPRRGFGGAIRYCWNHISSRSDAPDFVFHLEQDFTFNLDVPLPSMVAALNHHRNIVQFALRRQAWNEAEHAAGGVVEANADAYTDADSRFGQWLEHRLFFTTNPSLYRRELMDLGWPDCPHSEGVFSHELRSRQPDWLFAYWGARDSGEAVTHIGHQRVGVGY